MEHRAEAGRVEAAAALLDAFAGRTGVTTGAAPRRYLWTDAFAVCTCLELARVTSQPRWSDVALALVDGVHHTLGRHRGAATDPGGWISGLDAAAGEAHPTAGGLRIGKPLPERPEGTPADERLEWDRDGQYFHYLTKWMHALDQVSGATGDARYRRWACELADVAHRAFVYQGQDGRRRMYWKMSIDLGRPLVTSMGHHDPLDGLITCLQLSAGAADADTARLTSAVTDFASMVDAGALATADPLGIGGLLADAGRVAQLERQGEARVPGLAARLVEAALAGLRHYESESDLAAPAGRRLAFRELGLAIGLSAAPAFEGEPGIQEAFASLAGLKNRIESFWMSEEARQDKNWIAHADINDVMLATALVPGGFLRLRR